MVEHNKHTLVDRVRRRLRRGIAAGLPALDIAPPFPDTGVSGLRQRLRSAAVGPPSIDDLRVPDTLSTETLSRPGSLPVSKLRSTSRSSSAPNRSPGFVSPTDRFTHRGITDALCKSETTTPEYFIGVIPTSHESAVDKLKLSDFGVSYVSYPKELSDDDVECAAKSSWVYRNWPLGHFQLHVLLFETASEDEDVLYAYCHHEPNWLRHPISHLQQEYLNPDWGRARTVELLEAADLPVFTCADVTHESYERAGEYCAVRGENV